VLLVAPQAFCTPDDDSGPCSRAGPCSTRYALPSTFATHSAHLNAICAKRFTQDGLAG
jgi:hypothetical protein